MIFNLLYVVLSCLYYIIHIFLQLSTNFLREITLMIGTVLKISDYLLTDLSIWYMITASETEKDRRVSKCYTL